MRLQPSHGWNQWLPQDPRHHTRRNLRPVRRHRPRLQCARLRADTAIDLNLGGEAATGNLVTQTTYLAIWLSRNFWPPKPGSTVMIRIMSNSSRISKIGSTGSAGRTAKQALQPISRSWRARRTGAWVAPMWKLTDAAPNLAYSGAQRSGSSIIRCTSTGRSVTSQIRATIGSPKVRFGTNDDPSRRRERDLHWRWP